MGKVYSPEFKGQVCKRIIEGGEKEQFEKRFQKISEAISSDNFEKIYRKFRLGYEFPVKRKLADLFSRDGVSFSIFPRLMKFIIKFFKIAVFRR